MGEPFFLFAEKEKTVPPKPPPKKKTEFGVGKIIIKFYSIISEIGNWFELLSITLPFSISKKSYK